MPMKNAWDKGSTGIMLIHVRGATMSSTISNALKVSRSKRDKSISAQCSDKPMRFQIVFSTSESSVLGHDQFI